MGFRLIHDLPLVLILNLIKTNDIVVLCERDHRDTMQYDLILGVISDKCFIAEVGNVFTEIGTSMLHPNINTFLHTDGLTRDSLTTAILSFHRNCDWSPMWDSLFREIPGDRISFLCQNPLPKRSPTSKRAQAQAAAVCTVNMLASNGPPGTKWVSTRAILYHGKSVCWCVPVTVTTGKSSKVTLTSKNMMELHAG